MWNMPDDLAPGPEIEMFSGPGCAYCEASKQLLGAEGLPFIEYDVSLPEHLAEFTKRLPRVRSIPQIFVDGEHIGSYEDLASLVSSGTFA